MDEQLTAAAKTLPRWCYQRGVDERILGCAEQLLPSAAEQALGSRTAPQLERALWQQVAPLLQQRREWDRAHQIAPPAAAECIWCAVARASCPDHAPRRCRLWGGQLHRIVVDEGFDTQPLLRPSCRPRVLR